MIEPLFGSGSPMWTTIPTAGFPSAGFPFQTPVSAGNRPLVTPVFGSSTIPGLANGVSSGPQNLAGQTAVPVNAYASWPTVPQGFYAPSLVSPFPFASAPPAQFIGPVGPDAFTGVTVPALLAAVAMRRGQPQGPTNDQEVEDFIYDALELLPGGADVEVRCEGGRITLTGSVQQKRLKRDVGDIAWAIPGVSDVHNNVTITSRRRARSHRESESPSSVSTRKQA